MIKFFGFKRYVHMSLHVCIYVGFCICFCVAWVFFSAEGLCVYICPLSLKCICLCICITMYMCKTDMRGFCSAALSDGRCSGTIQ